MTERCALSFTWPVNLLQTRSIAQSKSIWFTFLFITIEGFTRNIASISIYFSLCIHPNVNMMDERSVHTFIEQWRPVCFTRIYDLPFKLQNHSQNHSILLSKSRRAVCSYYQVSKLHVRRARNTFIYTVFSYNYVNHPIILELLSTIIYYYLIFGWRSERIHHFLNQKPTLQTQMKQQDLEGNSNQVSASKKLGQQKDQTEPYA